MADTTNFTNIRALLGALTEAMNLISPDLQHHHEQTAYLSFLIAREMGMEEDLAFLCVYAALLHDVGSILADDLPSVLEIEREASRVASLGARMLRGLPEFSRVADVIEYCRARGSPWSTAADRRERIPSCSARASSTLRTRCPSCSTSGSRC